MKKVWVLRIHTPNTLINEIFSSRKKVVRYFETRKELHEANGLTTSNIAHTDESIRFIACDPENVKGRVKYEYVAIHMEVR